VNSGFVRGGLAV
jgi:hypothetical protein